MEADRAALVALYNATVGANWMINTNWLSNEPLSEWSGVTTNGDGRGHEACSRQQPTWTGDIPAELGDLSNLKLLSLANNQLTGDIPAELGDLSNLHLLWLANNQLTGDIPAELGNLANLQFLYLWGNQLTGSIPAELGNLTNLKQLILSGNNGLTGQLPKELGQLSNLESLGRIGHQCLCAKGCRLSGLVGEYYLRRGYL